MGASRTKLEPICEQNNDKPPKLLAQPPPKTGRQHSYHAGGGDSDCSRLNSDGNESSPRNSSSSRAPPAMSSCPDLRNQPRSSSETSPCPRNSGESRYYWGRRSSRSQPPTPTSLRHRIASQLRNVRIWRSAGGSSGQTLKSSPVSSGPSSSGISTPQDAKERRRRARNSGEHESSEENLPLPTTASQGKEATSPLAIASVMVATAELDRLSTLARQSKDLPAPGLLVTNPAPMGRSEG